MATEHGEQPLNIKLVHRPKESSSDLPRLNDDKRLNQHASVDGVTANNPSDETIVRVHSTPIINPSSGALVGEVDQHVQHKNCLQKYVLGNVQILSQRLSSKHISLRSLNWFVRALGAPIFLNNPISGCIILSAMFVNNAWTAVCGILGLSTAIGTALIRKEDEESIEAGCCTFHGLLVGIVLSASVGKYDWYPWLVVPVVLLAAISVYVNSGLSRLFHVWNLPVLNLPFCVISFIFLTACGPHNAIFPPRVSVSSEAETLDWAKLLLAIPRSVSQVYGSTNLISGGLILFAMLVSSPMLFAHAILGAAVSILTALGIEAPPIEMYSGEWSFNAMLCACALAGFFNVPSIRSHLIAVLAAAFSTLTYSGMKNIFQKLDAPVLAFPFVFTVSIFLSVASNDTYLKRVPLDSLTYPEEHRRSLGSHRVGT